MWAQNIAERSPAVVEVLYTRLDEYQSTMISPHLTDEIEEGNSSNLDGICSTWWCELEPV